jgi:hypothetical protein
MRIFVILKRTVPNGLIDTNKNNTTNYGNMLLGAVLFKSIKYKITINKCDNAHLIPTELRNDFIE